MEKIVTSIDRPSQYLAEYVCRREANKKKINLPEKFWNLPEWKVKYKKAIIAANKLLKIYDIKAILYALEKVKWCYSLHLSSIKDFAEEKQIELDKINHNIRLSEITEFKDNTLSKPRNNTYNSLINSIKDLE